MSRREAMRRWQRANWLADGCDASHWECSQRNGDICPDRWDPGDYGLIQFPRHMVAASLALDGLRCEDLP